MTVEINAGGVSAVCAVLVIVGGGVQYLVSSALGVRDRALNEERDARKEAIEDAEEKRAELQRVHDQDVAGLKSTAKILFQRSDAHARELAEYRVHVAESYVSQPALEKALAPLTARLAEIKQDIKELHK